MVIPVYPSPCAHSDQSRARTAGGYPKVLPAEYAFRANSVSMKNLS